MSTVNVNIAFMDLRTDMKSAMNANQVYIDKHPSFQRQYQEWTDCKKTRFVESILLGRATNPIWTISNPLDSNEVVLDGMHRMTVLLDYLHNKFKIVGRHLSELNQTEYDKKSFNLLSKEIQQKYRNYNLVFNILGPEYNDVNKRQMMYEILNRTSKPLNDFEFNKGMYGPLFNLVGEHMHEFTDTFFKQDNKRGRLQYEIIDVLLMADKLPSSWASLNDLRTKHFEAMMGKSEETVKTFMDNNNEKIKQNIKDMKDIIMMMNENKIFDITIKDLNNKHLPLKCFIGRMMLKMKKDSQFLKKYGSHVMIELKSKIICKDLNETLKCTGRNADFQRKSIAYIDELIETVL